MRPVNKKANNKNYRNYQDAKPDLIDEIGEYCSYCEVELKVGLAVEHLQPESLKPELSLKWDNFLLSCGSCNSSKGAKDIEPEDFLWPHKNNTFNAFIYTPGGEIGINKDLNELKYKKAAKTLELLGLNKRNAKNKYNKRHSNRIGAWTKACYSYKRLQQNDSPQLREEIIEHALDKGYWSIWMTVFKEDIDMRRRFIKEFKGTCKECFDQRTEPVIRKTGLKI
jgi:uncharacterized protein (TIGR02646 family)